MSNQPTQNHYEEAYMHLMEGLKELDLCGSDIPSSLVLNGDHAFPLAMNSRGQVLMAASLYGRGRIVVLGHESYLTAFPVLVENALTWLRGDGSDNLSVGVHRYAKGVADNLSESSFQVTVVGSFSESQDLGVYVVDAYSAGPDMNDLVAFMKAGGGVLIAGQAWTWAAEHPEESTLLHFEGNKVSGVAGIYFSEHQGEVECLPVNPQIPSSWKAVAVGKNFGDDLESLLQGVSDFDLQHGVLSSEILVHGPLAFPIGTTEDGRVFLAGTYYGQGRVIVITHEGLLGRETMAPFWNNALRWLDQGRNGVVGVFPRLGKAFDLFSKSDINCEKTKFREDLSVFACTMYSNNVQELDKFVAEGGGLLIGGHAWYWSQTHRGSTTVTDFPGNEILNEMGLTVLWKTIRPGLYKAPVVSEVVKDTFHFRHLLHCFGGHVTEGEDGFGEHEEEYLTRLSGDCATYLSLKAYESPSYTQVVSSLTDIIKKSDMPQVDANSPVSCPKHHLLLRVGADVFKACPDPDALLPYYIKDIPSLPVVENHKVKINADTAGSGEWMSTGLYLSPGMKTDVDVPAEIVNKGWKIQIGCHSDFLKHDVLKRAPRVHEVFRVTSEKTQVSNLWGGLLYLVAPPKTQKEVEVTVQTAVLAPYYKSGVTTVEEWLTLRTAPSPWAEMEFENIVLTVPSETVRDLDRPDELATKWDKIMRGIADLAAKPQKFARKERFVTDVQISAGFMHSGYPIMAHNPQAANIVSVETADRDMWGPIHELGHNQQRSCWEFRPHTTECTCNLWSIYVNEEVLGIDRAKAHPAVALENRRKRTEAYVKAGRDLRKWTSWLALETYMQLQEKFGWDAFKKVFAAYLQMRKFPRSNAGKMNLYAEIFSQTVEMNLSGFFKAWSWPIEAATEEKLSSLPPWSDHPMVQYDSASTDN